MSEVPPELVEKKRNELARRLSAALHAHATAKTPDQREEALLELEQLDEEIRDFTKKHPPR